MCDINMITSGNMSQFKDSVIVLDDMRDKLNKGIGYYFTERRHKKIQMIVMCHKPAQITKTARMKCDTIYLTTYNEADLFKSFSITYGCKYDFHSIIDELNKSYYNCTDAIASELRNGMIKYNENEKAFIIIGRKRTMKSWFPRLKSSLFER